MSMLTPLPEDYCKCEKPDTSTCGTCGFEWCEKCCPTPGARSPCEYDHEQEQEPTPDQEVRVAARKVVEAWERGDLAGAVRRLDEALQLSS